MCRWYELTGTGTGKEDRGQRHTADIVREIRETQIGRRFRFSVVRAFRGHALFDYQGCWAKILLLFPHSTVIAYGRSS